MPKPYNPNLIIPSYQQATFPTRHLHMLFPFLVQTILDEYKLFGSAIK